MRRRAYVSGPALDLRSLAEALSFPGIDPRTWISVGTVSTDTDNPVEFDVDHGQPFVQVTLHPSLTPVLCRVGGQVAGNGEGEWHPFVKGDEVLVACPEGFEDAGAVIFARLNNALDTFPMDSVGGQDPTTNSFAFRRRRAPFLEEVAGPIVFRNALTGSLFSLDEKGNVTLKDSENSALQIGADVIGFQGPSTQTSPPEFLLQLDLTGEHFVVQVKDAIFNIASSTASPEQSTLSVPGPFAFGTGTNAPIEHATSAEAVANVIQQAFVAFAALTTSNVGPLSGASFGPAILAWIATPAFAAIWETAAFASLATPCSTLPAAITTAFAGATQKFSNPAGQLFPGIGCSNLFLG